MTVRPESVEEWCHLVPHLLSDMGWHLIVQSPTTEMSHCSSPWGGSLVKLLVRDVMVMDPPEDPAEILIRPETRAWSWQSQPALSGEACEELSVIAPGDCVLHWWGDWKLVQLCNVMFGVLDKESTYLNFGRQVEVRDRLRRNFPMKGDCAVALHDHHQAFDYLMLCRPQSQERYYSVYLIFGITTDMNLCKWAAPHLRLMLDVARSTTAWYLNREGLEVERCRDQKLYLVLTITSFRRGYPLIPADASKDSITIDAGKEYGLANWVRYHPSMVGSRHFHLADYLRLFLERLGDGALFYRSLDGQELLPYQCVVRQVDWQKVRNRFHEAYMLQKKAYRHANGGTTTPKVFEDNPPRFYQEDCLASLSQRAKVACSELGLTVRNTFVELKEGDGVRASKRWRTLPAGFLISSP